MIANLMAGHLGDVLMAMPALRAGDVVATPGANRFPGAPFGWVAGYLGGVAKAPIARAAHATDEWLLLTGREPVRHELIAKRRRRGIVLAPSVRAQQKQWGLWSSLHVALRGADLLCGDASRREWMETLARAAVVVCPDTGTAHMADALGCPRVIALHGVPANWPRCAPYWDRRWCVARESMSAITVDDVMEVIRG